ncbi:hypothetical protein AMS56_22780 [Burkholderia pseudomallei]|nr:hypothetical protein ACT79_05775 [Burkholderia pseudomallei]ALC59655.1 hypothetical protein AMS56_22780 [Burkholderia pseudomallei]KGX54074.1 hypothetical protein Y024_5163 [Burkholderia pseudomallei TSV44]
MLGLSAKSEIFGTDAERERCARIQDSRIDTCREHISAGQSYFGQMLACIHEFGVDEIHLGGTDEFGNEAIARMVIEFKWRPGLRQASHLASGLAGVKQHHAVGERHGFHLVVGDVNSGRVTNFAMNSRDLVARLNAQGCVQIGKRLIE